MTSLKIAIVAPVYTAKSTWGPVTVIRNIVKFLKNKGHNFVIYAANAVSPNRLATLPSKEYIDGVLVKRYKTLLSIASYRFTPSMFKDLMRDNFDVVHAHCARSFQLNLAALVSKLRNKPLIVSAHGTLASYVGGANLSRALRCLHRVHNFALKLTLDQAQVCTALSELEARQFLQIFKAPKDKIVVIPNGVDPSLYLKLPPEGIFRDKYGIKDDRKIILYIGRINKVKGIDFLIRAFSYLINEMKCDKAVLVIAGPDDGYLHEAKSLSHSLGVGEKVVFTGFLTEYDKICAYVDSTVVVHPESFNVTLIAPLEAAASGKPIILSSGNYLSKIAERAGFGFSVPYGDIEVMAKLLQKILSEQNLAKSMGAKGREFVLGNLSWSAIAEKYEEIYLTAARIGMHG